MINQFLDDCIFQNKVRLKEQGVFCCQVIFGEIERIDIVGFVVDGANGYMEGDNTRMVRTPWFAEEIPFEDAAQIGTLKVIKEHSTIGILVTTDGSITEIPREDYIEAEENSVEAIFKFLKSPC